MSPRSSKRFERTTQIQTRLYLDILHSQQTDANGDLADTLLICDGGTIRVHAFLLQAASPFIQKAIFSQGENYPYIREIMLPDFSVKDMDRMVSLIYKGYADLTTDHDITTLKEILAFFQITGVDFLQEEIAKDIKGTVKVQELNRIPQDIFKESITDGSQPKVAVVIKGAKNSKKTTLAQESPVGVRRSGRPQKPIKKLNDDDSDYSGGSDYEGNAASNTDEETDEGESRPKRGKRPGPKPKVAVKLPKTLNTAAKSGYTTSLQNSPIKNVNNSKTTTTDKYAALVAARQNNDSSEEEADSEDDAWVKPTYKDKDWFDRESRRCQCCDKTFEKPAKASLCVTSHKMLRCYFCFRVYSTTDILFKHFKRRHKQAGRESTLICPFCDQAVPYKSVSCHVISVHLRSSRSDEKPINENFNRSVSVSSTSSPVKKTPSSSVSSTPSKSKSASDKDSSSNRTPRGPASSKVGSSRRRSRSRSTSVERMSSVERRPAKKPKPDSTADDQVRISNLKQIKTALLEQRKKNLKNSILQVNDLNITLEKTTCDGRRLVFCLQKSRSIVGFSETNGS